MQAEIKKKGKKFNIFIHHDGKKIPVGTTVGELLDKSLFKTSEFDSYEDAVKWIDDSDGKIVLREEVDDD